ncbi:hypothetical protein EGW08_015634 [Elysia chlorotica]|uniref:Uncharacterized protein n=1 Tax=Elysia chlorotica TaxID=188477 RepID=A0A3S1B034_ELYCH|nr:hypothetical protein EGW08_015634 [Elysia chlorotica]
MNMESKSHPKTFEKHRSSCPRRVTKPDKVCKEREGEWLDSDYLKPEGIQGVDTLSMMENFEKLIWKDSADLFLSKYGNSTKEMVAICAEGSEGWLLSSHMDWICQNLNSTQRKVLNAVCNFCDVESLRKLN